MFRQKNDTLSSSVIIYLKPFLVELHPIVLCSCLGSIHFSVDSFHDNDVKFVELRTYLASCVCTTSSNFEISI